MTPGDELSVDVRAFLDTTDGITLGKPLVNGPAGWTIAEMPRPDDNDADNPFARFFRESATASTSFRAQAPANAPLTQPYWLAQPRKSDLFDWPAGSPKGAPFAGPLLTASLPVQVAGVSFELTRPVEYRFADRVRGEIRRNVEVVPALTVGLDSRLLVVPSGAAPQQRTHGGARREPVTPAGERHVVAHCAGGLDRHPRRSALHAEARRAHRRLVHAERALSGAGGHGGRRRARHRRRRALHPGSADHRLPAHPDAPALRAGRWRACAPST